MIWKGHRPFSGMGAHQAGREVGWVAKEAAARGKEQREHRMQKRGGESTGTQAAPKAPQKHPGVRAEGS